MRALLFSLLACGCGFAERVGLGTDWNDAVRLKLDGIVVAEMKLEDVSLPEAVEALRAKALEFDKAKDPALRGLRIGYERMRASEVERLVRLDEKGKTIGQLIEIVAEQSNREFEVYRDGVVLRVPEVQVKAEGMVTRYLRVPPAFFQLGEGPVPVADDPFAATVARGEPQKFHKSAKDILGAQGVLFPEGSMARYLPNMSLLVVRNEIEQIELVEVFCQSMGTGPLQRRIFCRLDVEVYSMSLESAKRLSRRASGGLGGLELRRKVDGLIEVGEAKLVASPGITTRSGQRAKVESGAEFRHVSGVKTEGGVDSFEFETDRLGTTLEVDPVIGSGGEIIEINIAIRVATGELEMRKQPLLLPSTGKVIEVDVPQIDSAELTTACTVKTGIPQYLGVLGGAAEPGEALVAFLTGTIEVAGATLEVLE